MSNTVPTRAEANDAVKASALERATRTLWQGLGLDVAVAVAVAVLAWLPAADVSSGMAWQLLGLSLLKTVLQTAASYVMRLKLAAPSAEAPIVDGAYVVTDAQHGAGFTVAELDVPQAPRN